MVLLKQMIIFFVIMMVGFLCRKVKVFTETSAKTISSVVVNIANPALMIAAVTGDTKDLSRVDLARLFLMAFILYAVLLLLAFLLPKILKVSKEDTGIYKLMVVFSNIGFMGYPLLQAMYGSYAVLCALPFNLIYNILIYTYGVHELTKGTSHEVKMNLKKIFNVGVIFGLIAIAIFFIRIPVPEIVNTVTSKLGDLTGPLSMLVIGDNISQMKFKTFFSDVRLIIFSVIKLILIPVVGLFILKPLGLSDVMMGVCLVMLATPVGSMTAMFAQQYETNYETAARGVALTTILSVATMPLVALIVGI